MQVGKKVNKNNICNLRKRTKYSSYQDALGNLCVCACSVMSESSRPHRLQPTRFLCPQDSPGKNTGVGCHFLLQGIFPTQESNPGLLYCRQMIYSLSHQGGHTK